jgi:hypothetical protein
MSDRTPEKILETVLKAVPHPHLIENIELQPDAIVLRFTWRGTRYRVDELFRCEEIGEGVLIGSDLAILMERTLQLTAAALRNGGMVQPS